MLTTVHLKIIKSVEIIKEKLISKIRNNLIDGNEIRTECYADYLPPSSIECLDVEVLE